MAKPGRKPNPIPNVRWEVQINGILAAETDLLLRDPMRNKLRYSERSRLVEKLLQRWIDELRFKRKTPLETLMEEIRFELRAGTDLETARRNILDRISQHEAKLPPRHSAEHNTAELVADRSLHQGDELQDQESHR